MVSILGLQYFISIPSSISTAYANSYQIGPNNDGNVRSKYNHRTVYRERNQNVGRIKKMKRG